MDSVLPTGRMVPAATSRRLKRVCGKVLATGLIGISMAVTTSAHAGPFAPANLSAGSLGAGGHPPVTGWRPAVAHPAGGPATGALIIGDSVLNALETSTSAGAALAERHTFTIDAKVCRRLIARSCAYQGTTPATALEVLRANPGVYGTLVIGAGYNDGSIATAIDAFVAEARTRGIGHVVWINYHETGSLSKTFAAHNSALRAKLGQYPELSIIDWNDAVGSHPTWAGADGLHLTPAGAHAVAGLIADALDQWVVIPPPTRCARTVLPVEQSLALTPGPRPAPAARPSPLGLHPLAKPVRLLDTRRLPSPMRPGDMLSLVVAGQLGIPFDAVGVSVTVTAVDTCAATYLTVFPCGSERPETSMINAPAGSTVANSAVVALGTEGALCVFASGATDLLIDASGWIAPAGEGLVPLSTPIRLIDTRPGTPHLLPDAHRLAAGETLAVDAGRLDQVVGSGLLGVNVTAVQPAGTGYLTVFPGPCNGPRPEASNLNTVAGRDIAAGAIVANKIGGPGVFCVFSSVSTDVIVDLASFSRSATSTVEPIVPFRALDTRQTTAINAGQVLAVSVPATTGSSRFGFVGNLTAVDPLGDGYLTIHPCGNSLVPEVSNLNVRHGDTVANMVVSGLGDNPQVCIYSSVTTHVLLDIAVWLTSNEPRPA